MWHRCGIDVVDADSGDDLAAAAVQRALGSGSALGSEIIEESIGFLDEHDLRAT